MPARLRSSCSSFENALHSGPVSSMRSVTTNPQFPQNISPLELSVTIGPFPHLGQRSLNKEISLTNSNTPQKFRQCCFLYLCFILIYMHCRKYFWAANI
jgi:hypothetical protein